jgi:L-threonylcarbamoyladenylate synthase
VYGLGARAVDDRAAASIFEAKQRPAGSPLIVHVSSIEMGRRYTSRWPDAAQRLAEAFWPGPLSLVLPKSGLVPAHVSAGGETVAVRAPAHAVALALIDALGEGIAAPSANRSSRLPPVRAQHVLKGLDGRIEMVLDAGACPGGVESTVVELTGERARVLRRGGIAFERIAALVDAEDCATGPVTGSGWVQIVAADRVGEGSAALLLREREVGVEHRVLGDDPVAFGAAMYDALHELEDAGYAQVLVEELPEGGAWDAIRDRLARL